MISVTVAGVNELKGGDWRATMTGGSATFITHVHERRLDLHGTAITSLNSPRGSTLHGARFAGLDSTHHLFRVEMIR